MPMSTEGFGQAHLRLPPSCTLSLLAPNTILVFPLLSLPSPAPLNLSIRTARRAVQHPLRVRRVRILRAGAALPDKELLAPLIGASSVGGSLCHVVEQLQSKGRVEGQSDAASEAVVGHVDP